MQIKVVFFSFIDYTFKLLNSNTNYNLISRRHFNSKTAHNYTGIGSLNRRYNENRNAFNLKLGSIFKKDQKPLESEKIKNILNDETLSNDEKQRLKVRIQKKNIFLLLIFCRFIL